MIVDEEKVLFVSCHLFQPECAVSQRPYRCVVTVTHLEIKGLMDFSLSLSFCLTLKKITSERFRGKK